MPLGQKGSMDWVMIYSRIYPQIMGVRLSERNNKTTLWVAFALKNERLKYDK